MIHISGRLMAGYDIEEACAYARTTIREVVARASGVEQLLDMRHPTNQGFRDLTLTGEYEGLGTDEVDITFYFNNIRVTVKADSDPALIAREVRRAMLGYTSTGVGPYPNPVLTKEDKENDKKKAKKAAAAYARSEAKNKRKADARRARLAALLADAPPMEFADKPKWDKEAQRLNLSIIAYAEYWARLMQRELSAGQNLADIWVKTSRKADLEGMSGYGTDIAVLLLTETWIHGVELGKLQNASLLSG